MIEEKETDARWCELGEGRYGEYGVIGAEQADESHLDDREWQDEEGEDDDFGADGRIHFAKHKLYGRDKELDQCRELFDDNNQSSAVVFLSGYSGSGKSRMVEEFIHLNSGTIIEGKVRRPPILYLLSKCDSTQASVPFSSLSGLFDNIDKSVVNEFVDMQDEIQESLRADARILLKIFPQLEQYFSKERTSRSANSWSSDSDSLSVASSNVFTTAKNETKQRMMFALQFFFRTLCRRSKRPVVLFVDDLQWVDVLSLELIQSLLSSAEVTNLFFIGGFRSNEVDEEHILTKKMNEIEDERAKKEIKGCLCIELKELDKEAVGQFIADSLRLSFDETLPLTNVVFSKTIGNPFFTRQALEYLVLKNALYYDNICFRWDWKLQEKEMQDLISDDLLEMVKSKIQHLSPELQEVLITASCTRSTFDADTILVLLHPQLLRQSSAKPSEEMHKKAKKSLVDLLNQAVVEGLLIQPQIIEQTPQRKRARHSVTKINVDESNGEEYAFAHDRIQETARSLVSDENDCLERIGNTLHQRAQCALHGEDWMFFTACDHLNRCWDQQKILQKGREKGEQKPDNKEQEKHFRLATLNVRTAELSIDLLAFPAALDYCERGITYLPADDEERWSDKYHDTTLKLLSIAAQAKYCLGDQVEADRYCNEVISKRSGDEPKVTTIESLPVILIYLEVLRQKGDNAAALQLGLDVLKHFGIKVPRSRRALRAKVWWTLKQIKSRYLPTEDSVQSMPQVSDPLAADKMELIQRSASIAFSAEDIYIYVLLSCEAVIHIAMHGLTDTSAASIASFSNVLMHVYNDFKTSPRLAKLAILIADRQGSKFNETQPLNTANHNVMGWVQPLASTLKYHERAYLAGMASGNVNGAVMGKWFGFHVKFFSCSVALPELDTEFCEDILEMRKLGQNFIANMACSARQLVLNLVGKPGNPNTTLLTGESIDESTELYQEKMPFCSVFRVWKSIGLVHFGDWENAAESALERGDEFPKFIPGMMYGYETIMRVLPLFVMARSNSKHKAKYKKEAMRLLKKVRSWVKKGCINLEGLLQLLDAENMALRKRASSARSYFEMAISTCRKDGFHQFAGLSCELYSTYLSETGDSKGEKMYLQAAIDDYTLWGALRKVDILKKQLTTQT